MSSKEKIVEILKQVSGKASAPDAGESLFESGYLDSFGLADVAQALEKEFKVSIPDSDLTPRKFESIDSIESYIESRQ
jgi:acyl carrier protein